MYCKWAEHDFRLDVGERFDRIGRGSIVGDGPGAVLNDDTDNNIDRMNFIRIRRFVSLAALGLVGLAPALYAHPGHGMSDADVRHIITNPDHLAVLALGGLALCLGARWVERRLSRRLLQGAGLAALVTATVLWGLAH